MSIFGHFKGLRDAAVKAHRPEPVLLIGTGAREVLEDHHPRAVEKIFGIRVCEVDGLPPDIALILKSEDDSEEFKMRVADYRAHGVDPATAVEKTVDLFIVLGKL